MERGQREDGVSSRVSLPNSQSGSFTGNVWLAFGLLVLLQSSEADKFVAHLYLARRQYRIVCERPNRCDQATAALSGQRSDVGNRRTFLLNGSLRGLLAAMESRTVCQCSRTDWF